MTQRIPKKLRNDAIVEALCETRFKCGELSEIVVGRLSDFRPWHPVRLPVADIPEALRAMDANLKYQPIVELRDPEGVQRIRIGGNVLSFHLTGEEKYCGWEIFAPQLEELFRYLFERLTEVSIFRAGFRYINALTFEKHHISSVNDLNLNIEVGDATLSGPVNLNYQVTNDVSHITMTRIASPVFVQGELPRNTTAVVDIDVTSPDGLEIQSVSQASEWARVAHGYEKQAFFSLIPEAILSKVVEEW